MRTRLHIVLGSLLVLSCFFSCSRPPFSVLDIHPALNSVRHYDRDGSLTASYESLSLFIESEENAFLQMEITSPDGLNSWIFPAEKRSLDKESYYGRGSLSLGQRVPIPQGQWLVRILNSDGRTISEHFTITRGSEAPSYQNLFDAVEGTLLLDERIAECALQLLDEKRGVLHRSTTTEQMIDLTSLYAKWDRVSLVGLAWYDESSKANLLVWYEL